MKMAPLLLLLNPFALALAANSPLTGVWQIVSEQPAMSGLYVFTATHYSMVAAASGRPEVDTGKASADELRAVWGPMIANAGTYEIAGDRITIHPLVAKIPLVMKPDAYEVYQFRIEGNTLTLRQVRNARGIAVESAPTFRFIRVE